MERRDRPSDALRGARSAPSISGENQQLHLPRAIDGRGTRVVEAKQPTPMPSRSPLFLLFILSLGGIAGSRHKKSHDERSSPPPSPARKKKAIKPPKGAEWEARTTPGPRDNALPSSVMHLIEMLAKEGKGAGAVASIQAARPQARAKAEAAPAPPQAAAAERGHTRRTHAKSRDKPGKRRPGTRGTTS